jgi:hypothetical protein
VQGGVGGPRAGTRPRASAARRHWRSGTARHGGQKGGGRAISGGSADHDRLRLAAQRMGVAARGER